MQAIVLRSVAILIVAIFLVSCGQAGPTEEDGRVALEQKMRGHFPKAPTITVTKFAKTGGAEKHVGGVPGYEMQYSATIEFPKGLVPSRSDFEDDREASMHLIDLLSFRHGFKLVQGTGRKLDVPYVLLGDGVLTFQKTERGWVALR